jgi:hypothetical protein
MARKALIAMAASCVCGAATAAAQSCIVKLDVPYDFDDGLAAPYNGTPTNSASTTLRAWQDNYAFPPPLQRQRTPDYVQSALSPTNVQAGPNSADPNGGFAALFTANNPVDADGFWINYDFRGEPGLVATGGDVTVRFDYAPGHWHGNGSQALDEWVADATSEVRAFVGDGATYAGEPLGPNPFFGEGGAVNRDVRRLTGPYAGRDDGDSDGWPDMPEVSQTAPGTSWRTETIQTELAASNRLYVGITGFGPNANANRRAVFVDAVQVRVTSRETDLTLSATGPSGPLVATDEAEFTVTITNEGGSDEDPVVAIELPGGVSVRGSVPDLASGRWTVGPLAIGESRTLTIPVRVDRTDPYGDLFLAEVAEDRAGQGASDDCDSDPLNDSGTEDDEARLPVTIAERTIGGVVFLDEGQGGTAYDGVRTAGEASAPGVTVAVRDAGTDELLFETITGPDGAWFVPAGDLLADRAVTVSIAPPASLLSVSEAAAYANGSRTDATAALTVPAGTTVSGIDFGLVRVPTLLQDRLGTVAAGDTRYLLHRYRATGASQVTFALAKAPGPQAEEFAGTLLRDQDCDGLPGAFMPLASPIAVTADEEVCLLLQISASQGAQAGAVAAFALRADTAFGATGVASEAANTDRLTLAAGALIALTKEVCNLTEQPCDLDGGGYAAFNTARPGEALRYRLSFESVGEEAVELVTVRDATPGFTSLLPNTAIAHRSPPGASCTVEEGGGGQPGYRGEVRWACAGTIAPGASGVVAFDVRVEE